MLRIIAGIIVGFIVMAVLVMATFGITMAVLGLENILQSDSWWTTDTFNIIVLIGGTIAAIVGGLVCKAIARTSTATFGLIGIVLAMGIGSFITNMNRPDPPARDSAEFTTMELNKKMELIQHHGKEPNWFAAMKTVLAVAGLLIGSSLIKGRKP